MIRLWNPDGTLRHQLNAEKSVWALAFSPDGKRLVSGSADGMVRVWDLQGNMTQQFQADHEVFTVRFSSDGQRIVIGGKDDMFHVWQWNVGWHAGLQTACERLRSHPLGTQAELEEAQEIRAICKQFASVTWPVTSSQRAADCP
jgi:WD40 repeat protein